MYYPIVGAIELISAGYEGSVSDTTNNNSDTSSHLKAVGYLALVLDTLAAVSHNTSHVHRSVFYLGISFTGNLLHSAKEVHFFNSSL